MSGVTPACHSINKAIEYMLNDLAQPLECKRLAMKTGLLGKFRGTQHAECCTSCDLN